MVDADLPNEILELIFNQLQFDELRPCLGVCKRWRFVGLRSADWAEEARRFGVDQTLWNRKKPDYESDDLELTSVPPDDAELRCRLARSFRLAREMTKETSAQHATTYSPTPHTDVLCNGDRCVFRFDNDDELTVEEDKRKLLYATDAHGHYLHPFDACFVAWPRLLPDRRYFSVLYYGKFIHMLYRLDKRGVVLAMPMRLLNDVTDQPTDANFMLGVRFYAMYPNHVAVYNIVSKQQEESLMLQPDDADHSLTAVLAGDYVVRMHQRCLQVYDKQFRLLRQLDERNVKQHANSKASTMTLLCTDGRHLITSFGDAEDSVRVLCIRPEDEVPTEDGSGQRTWLRARRTDLEGGVSTLAAHDHKVLVCGDKLLHVLDLDLRCLWRLPFAHWLYRPPLFLGPNIMVVAQGPGRREDVYDWRRDGGHLYECAAGSSLLRVLNSKPDGAPEPMS